MVNGEGKFLTPKMAIEHLTPNISRDFVTLVSHLFIRPFIGG